MRVVITGASGNVGTSLVRALEADGSIDEIVGLVRRRPSWTPPKTRWIEADVASSDLRSALLGADAVVHLAWLFQPTHDPNVTWHNNVVGSRRVFEAVAAARVPVLVHASSVGAYSQGPEHGMRVDESWPTEALPTAAYGREKSYVERILDAFEMSHPSCRVVRLRPGFIFKRPASQAQRRLFLGPLVPNGLFRTELLPVFPWEEGLTFQALHADDAAEAYRLALHRDVAGAFNVAADPVVDGRVLERVLGARALPMAPALLRAVVSLAWRARLVPASPHLIDLVRSLPLMDVGRARTELGWEPRWTAEEAVAELLEGLRRGEGFDSPPLRPDEPGDRLAQLADGVGESDDVPAQQATGSRAATVRTGA